MEKVPRKRRRKKMTKMEESNQCDENLEPVSEHLIPISTIAQVELDIMCLEPAMILNNEENITFQPS